MKCICVSLASGMGRAPAEEALNGRAVYAFRAIELQVESEADAALKLDHAA